MVQTFHEGGGNTPFLSEREYSKEEQMHYRAEPNQQTIDQEQGILSQLRVTEKSTVICGGICASSMGINTPTCPSFFYTGTRARRTEVVHIQGKSQHGVKMWKGHKLRPRTWKVFPGPTPQSWL